MSGKMQREHEFAGKFCAFRLTTMIRLAAVVLLAVEFPSLLRAASPGTPQSADQSKTVSSLFRADPEMMSIHLKTQFVGAVQHNVFSRRTYTVREILNDLNNILAQSNLTTVISHFGGQAGYNPRFTDGDQQALSNVLYHLLFVFPKSGEVFTHNIAVGEKSYVDEYGNYFTTTEPDQYDPLPFMNTFLLTFYAGRDTAAAPLLQALENVEIVSQMNRFRIHAYDDAASSNQNITFPMIPDQTITSRVGLAATASSGLPVSFSVVTGPAQITHATNLSFTSTGIVCIVASQAGDIFWHPAPSVTNTFMVNDITTSTGVSADYDGDGKADPTIYLAAESTAETLQAGDAVASIWRIKLSSANYNQLNTTFGGLGGPLAASASADFDGDGRADPAVYYAMTARWEIMPSSANYTIVVTLPQPLGDAGFSAMAADYDGDRLADPAVYQRTNGNWTILMSSANYAALNLLAFVGGTGWRAAAADYDGDNKADPAVYGETSGDWIIRLSSAEYTTMTLSGFLGGPDYIACPADYDGDGRADPAVINITSNEWIIRISTADYAPLHLQFQF